ncbi:MAG: Crp/Fnr family transcriptional regulator [Thermoleophilaceae bacterium]
MGLARVLDEDPELGERLSEPERTLAAEAGLARVETVEQGVWREPQDRGNYRDGYGLFVLEGILARRVNLERFECTELLGQGDLLRPWTFEGATVSSVRSQVSWTVIEPVRMAVLDRRFAVVMARWPEVTASLMHRIVQRARWLAFQLAVCHLVRVDMRLLVILWHYADRWGRMTKDGAVLHMPLTHSMLASVIGARRPSVTTALGRLEADRLVERREDGSWLLRGEPPSDFVRLRETAGATSEPLDAEADAEPREQAG